MRFLSVFRKPAQSKCDECSIPFEDIVPFYRKKCAGPLRKAESTAHELQERIREQFITLPLQQLENAAFERHDKQYAAVNMAKAAYIRKAKSLLRTLPLSGETHADILNFHTQSASILSSMNGTQKQSMVLTNFFKKESEAIVSILKDIDASLKELKSFLSTNGSILVFMQKLEALQEEQSDAKSRMCALKEKEQSLLADMRSAERKKRKIEHDMRDFLSGSEWKEYEEVHIRLEAHQRQREEAQARMEHELAPLRRPMKKAQHVLRDAKMVQWSSPFSAVMSDDGETMLFMCIKAIQSLISEKKITLKRSEREKLTVLSNRVKDGVLTEMKERCVSLNREIAEDESLLNTSVIRKKQELNAQAAAVKERMLSIAAEQSVVAGNLHQTQKELADKKKICEATIRTHSQDMVTVL